MASDVIGLTINYGINPKSIRISILGTEYVIKKYKYRDKEEFKRRGIYGYCDSLYKEIAYADMSTYPGYENETSTYLNLYEKQMLRHEIVHAFLHESGLQSNTEILTSGWATNEEMIDWIALQAPKMFKAFKDANCF